MEEQAAPLALGQLAQVVLSATDKEGLHILRDHWLDSINLLGQNQLGFVKHLQSTAASVLRGRLLPHGQVPFRQGHLLLQG